MSEWVIETDLDFDETLTMLTGQANTFFEVAEEGAELSVMIFGADEKELAGLYIFDNSGGDEDGEYICYMSADALGTKIRG